MSKNNQNYDLADAVVQTIHEPLVILDKNLIIRLANDAFLQTFNINRRKTLNNKFKLNHFDNGVLFKALKDLVEGDKSIKELEIDLNSKSSEKKNLLVNARKIKFNDSKNELILLAFEDITSQQQLLTSLTKQVNLLNQVSEAVITTDLNDFIIQSWNKAAEEIFGYSKEEAIGKKFSQILKISYLYTTEKNAHRELMRNGHWEGQTIQENKKGDKLYTLISRSLIRNKKNIPTGTIAVIRDIQLQIEQQEKLAFHSAIVNSTAEAVYSKDIFGNITSWNEASEKLYGYKEREVLGKHVNIIVPKNLVKNLDQIRVSVVKNGKSKRIETKRLKKDGSVIDIILTLSPIKNNYGKVIGLAALTHDISGRKQQEANLRFLAEASKVLSASLDYEETLKQVADLAVPEIADWCSIDVLNEEDNSIEQIAVSHIDPKKVEFAKKLRKLNPVDLESSSGLAKVIKTGEPLFLPHISDDEIKKMELKKSQIALLKKLGLKAAIIMPLKYHSKIFGAITLVSAESKKHFTKNDFNMAEELSRRAVVSIENARAYKKEQQAVQLREEFISVASHELKTPVTSLKVYSQVLKKKLKANNRTNTDKYFNKMNNQIDKLNTLISDLLNVSRLKNGQLEFENKPFDINEVVKSSVELIQPTTDDHNIKIAGKINRKVKGDAERVGQVISNLLNNAIKYSPNANRVNIILRNSKKMASITVEDFGIGIDEDKIDSLFERFYRVEGEVQSTFPGLGIGLYIAKEIASRHGGEIKVKSKKGKGSKFTFLIPYS